MEGILHAFRHNDLDNFSLELVHFNGEQKACPAGQLFSGDALPASLQICSTMWFQLAGALAKLVTQTFWHEIRLQGGEGYFRSTRGWVEKYSVLGAALTVIMVSLLKTSLYFYSLTLHFFFASLSEFAFHSSSKPISCLFCHLATYSALHSVFLQAFRAVKCPS